MKKEKAYIWDIDGTLAGFVEHCDRKCLEKMKTREVIEEAAYLCRILAMSGYCIIILTGRSEESRLVTARWLDEAQIPHHVLLMRKDEDHRKDMEVKEEIYHERIKDTYHVLGVFDDRLRVCQMWHRIGLTVFRVGDPDSCY